MKFDNILILREDHHKPIIGPNTRVIRIQELGKWIKSGQFIFHLFRYRESTLYVHSWPLTTEPFSTALAVRLLSRGTSKICDETGDDLSISIFFVLNLFINYITGLITRPTFLLKKRREVKVLSRGNPSNRTLTHMNLESTPIYLRTDHVFGLKAGGSVGHTAGVLNNLSNFSRNPIFITAISIPTIREDIETHLVPPSGRLMDFRELPFLDYNDHLTSLYSSILADRQISFVYQRYSIHNYFGLILSQSQNVPFVLEYNGSEVWLNRNWGIPLKYERLAEKIELANLHGAELVVVVSNPMKDELIGRNIDPDKILVNPNGVDPDAYSPEISGTDVRRQYSLEGKTVIGFIGTFGRWHGAEILAQAYGLLIKNYPDYRRTTHLLMIGDGNTMQQVKTNVDTFNIADNVTLTGIVPQEEGPAHLAACDLLASPHVPNPDGTPFFGSPTKLFEYMAMGKGIIASDLDQIGELLDHDHTAWMVKPGDAESLMLGLKTMIDNPEISKRLGEAARSEVVVKYTWKEHTRKIIEKLKERCPCD